MLFINMFAIYFISKILLDVRESFHKTNEIESKVSNGEIQDAYNTGSLIGWKTICYTLKMMEDDCDILDYRSLIDGIENKIRSKSVV